MSQPGRSTEPLRSPHLWAIAGLTVILAISYYADHFDVSTWIPFGKSFFTVDYVHDLHRSLFLAPMLYAAAVFRLRGALVMSLAAFCIVLPRSLFISTNPDPLFRTSLFIALASLAAVSFGLERDRRQRLATIHAELDTAHAELHSNAELLKASEERYRDLFESASEAIIIIDLDGRIVEINRAGAALFGYPLEELVEKSMRELFTPRSFAVARQRVMRRLQGEAIADHFEGQLVRKDQTEAMIDATSRIITAGGQPSAIQVIARDITEERRLQENMRFYIDQITKAQEEERKRIARELHDETAQALAALSLNVDAITRAKEPLSQETLERLEQLQDRIDGIMEGVRRFSHELRPAMVDQLGLLPALEWLAEDMSATCGIDASVEIAGAERRLSPDVELVLFRIAQEALTNVRKHSEATKAVVSMEFGQEGFRLAVTDNGKGFELPGILDDLAVTGRLGILGIQERARLIDGRFSLESEPGKGTKVVVEVTGQV